MNTFEVTKDKSHGLEIFILITFCDGDYCDERTFMSYEYAYSEGLRWLKETVAA